MITPGAVVTTFTTKTGLTVAIRYAQVSDAEALAKFVNSFSLETSFTRFAGEQLTVAEETEYLKSEVAAMANADAVKLFCIMSDEIVGSCDVHRDTSLLTRKRHTGIFGIIIDKTLRGQGVGETLMKTTIDEAVKHIPDLKLIKLDCFANNTPALALYKKLGFVQVGLIPQALKYQDALVNEVIMVKTLT